jgi:hypothetical protein
MTYEYKEWLDYLDRQRQEGIMRSCADCSYSIKEDLLRLGSPLYCYNRSCSHISGNWTSCTDARDMEYGLCGPEGKFYKEKMETEA